MGVSKHAHCLPPAYSADLTGNLILDWLVFLFRCLSEYKHVKQCCENSHSCLRNLT